MDCQKCLAQNRFDAKFLKAYDVRVARVLGTELKLSYRLQQIMQHQRITNFLTNLVADNPKIIELLCRMYTDFELRKQLVNPLFWWRQFWAARGKKLKVTSPEN